MSQVFRFNVAIVGASGVGKSAYMVRQRSGTFVKEHKQHDQSRCKMYYFSNVGIIKVSHQTSSSTSIVTPKTDAVMVMFSVTDKNSLQYAVNLMGDIMTRYPGLPVVLVGNKVDIRNRAVKAQNIRPRYYGVKVCYFDFSVKSNYNFASPILRLLRSNLGINDLHFVDPSTSECDPQMTEDLVKKLENENNDKTRDELDKCTESAVDMDELEYEQEEEYERDMEKSENAMTMHKEMSMTFGGLSRVRACRL